MRAFFAHTSNKLFSTSCFKSFSSPPITYAADHPSPTLLTRVTYAGDQVQQRRWFKGTRKAHDRLTHISALKPFALCLKQVARFEWLKAERGDTANTKRVLKTVRPSCRALILLATKYLAWAEAPRGGTWVTRTVLCPLVSHRTTTPSAITSWDDSLASFLPTTLLLNPKFL